MAVLRFLLILLPFVKSYWHVAGFVVSALFLILSEPFSGTFAVAHVAASIFAGAGVALGGLRVLKAVQPK